MTSSLMGRFFFLVGATITSSIYHHSQSLFSFKHDHDSDNSDEQHKHKHHHNHHNDNKKEIFLSKKEKDKIISLPGIKKSTKKHDNNIVNFDQYSGYLTVDKERHFFYWYVESQNDPENDPVVFWTNGGPGCSGLYGFGGEHGPFIANDDLSLSLNPYSWNTKANMLYIEQPIGVGFSYSETSTTTITTDDANVHEKDTNIDNDNYIGDAQVASDNYEFIIQFLLQFPERQSNDFYITGESFGGHYIPWLAREIMIRNHLDNRATVNLKGMLIGNPYVEPYSNALTQYDAFYNHGLLPKPLYDDYKVECLDPNLNNDTLCLDLLYNIFDIVDNGMNPYALDYPVCLQDPHPFNTASTTTHNNNNNDNNRAYSHPLLPMSLQAKTTLLGHVLHAIKDPPFLSTNNYRPCREHYWTEYLNQLHVQQALHVINPADEDPKTLFTPVTWSACSRTVSYNPIDRFASQVELYNQILLLIDETFSDKNFEFYIISGDDDAVCSLAGTQEWIWDLESIVPSTTSSSSNNNYYWYPWRSRDTNQVGGYITEFQYKHNITKKALTFVTVHGAGHEVPAYRPMEALQIFENFIGYHHDKKKKNDVVIW